MGSGFVFDCYSPKARFYWPDSEGMCNPALSQVSRLKPRGLVIPHLEGTIYNLFCEDLFYRHAILMNNLANETAQNGESNCIFASFLLRALDSTFTSFMTPISFNFSFVYLINFSVIFRETGGRKTVSVFCYGCCTHPIRSWSGPPIHTLPSR